MNPALAITFGVLSVLATLYAAYDLWQRRSASNSLEVMKSAVGLLAPYKEEVAQLRRDLTGANLTIVDLTGRLNQADLKVSELNGELENARTELAYFRLQVHTLSTQLAKGVEDK